MKSNYLKTLKENQILRKKKFNKTTKIGISSNININFFDEILANFFLKKRINPSIKFGIHNNFLQDSYDYKNKNITIIFWETINLFNENLFNIENRNLNKLKKVEQNIKLQLKKIFLNLNKNELILFNKFSKNFVNKKDRRIEKIIDNLNNFLFKQEKINNNLKIISYEKFSKSSYFDYKKYDFTKSIFKLDFFYRYIKNIEKFLIKDQKFKKVLIVDCDNTLWKGALGEDGYENLKMSKKDPEGKYYYLAQKEILNLAVKGVIVCICSKNNEKDFFYLQKKRKDFLIKNKHIVLKKINWVDKHKNILDIAKSLNLNIDSFVFLDDSEFEINLVKKYCENITTFKVPKNIRKYPLVINRIKNLFDVKTYTEEDRKKIFYYKKNFKREEFKENFDSIDDYLKKLKIKLILQKKNHLITKRISQMTLKTNQFNLTNSRYNEDKIKKLIKRDDIDLYAFSVKDIFGDNGITVLLICKIKEHLKEVFIDTFLLSCRVFGRKIEKRVLHFIIQKYQKKFKKIISKFEYNGKNNQFKNFYKDNYFRTVKTKKNEIYLQYDLKLKKLNEDSNFIKIVN